jgi:hypothetical protein
MRITLLFLVLGFIPLFPRLSQAVTNVFHDPGIALVLFSAWGLTAVLIFARLQEFRCPRCGRTFFKESWRVGLFSSRCVHCGLRKYAKSGEAHEDR